MSEILGAFLANEEAIRRFLRRCGVNSSDLEDFVQETFLRGFAAETKSDIAEPKAYLFQIARNITLEQFRKRARTPHESLEDSGGADILLDEDRVAADEWLSGRRKLMLFARAVAALPPQCRKAFLMRRIEGLQYKQIANRMGITVSAVEKHVAVGLLKCNTYLKAHGYEPSEFGAKPQASEQKREDGAVREEAAKDDGQI